MTARDEDAPAVSRWLAAGLSALLVVGILGFLAWEALAVTDTPPRLAARVDSVFAAPDGWQVAVTVVNEGSSTAASVRVRGEAGGAAGEAVLDYVPAGSSRRLALLFDADPRPAGLTVRVVGFDYP